MEGVECTDEFSLLVSCGLGLANMEKNNNQTLQRLEILNIDVKTRLVSSNIRLMATLHLPQNQIICIKSLMMLAKNIQIHRDHVWQKHMNKKTDSLISFCCQGNQMYSCRSHCVEDQNAHTYTHT